jgi:hypothetical protein
MRRAVSWTRKLRVFPLLATFFGGWVLLIGYLLWREPDPGAATPERLEAAMRSAVETKDADRLALLFVDGTIGDDYATAYLAELEKAQISSVVTSTKVSGGQTQLILTAAGDSSRSSPCTAWPLVRDGDRWKLDGVPALNNACSLES